MRRIAIGILLTGICFVGWNCADQQVQPDNSPYCNISLSRTKGMVNKHYAGQITYNSNFVGTAEYFVNSELPPGLALNSTTGIIEGTPTTAGFWQVELRVRDRDHGTHNQLQGQTYWYYSRVELAIYDRLVDEH